MPVISARFIFGCHLLLFDIEAPPFASPSEKFENGIDWLTQLRTAPRLTRRIFRYLNPFQICRFTLDCGGTMDQIKRDDQPQPVFLPKDDPLQALKRPRLDPHASASG